MINIAYEKENKRSAAYDGENLVGECTYLVRNDLWIINHTFVSPSYGGQGIAKKLVEKLVQEARKKEVKIYPLCPFAQKEFKDKPQYADVLAPSGQA